MTRNRKFENWLIVNTMFICALYIALWQDIRWLTLTSVSFIWVVLLANVVAYCRRDSEHYVDPAPRIGYLAVALVLYALLTHGWYLTAGVWMVSESILFLVYYHSKHQNKALTANTNSGTSKQTESDPPAAADS